HGRPISFVPYPRWRFPTQDASRGPRVDSILDPGYNQAASSGGGPGARRLRLMVVSGVVGMLGLAPPASSAQVPIQVILPIGGFFDIVVDDSHQHVFVTGDPSLNNLRVVAVDYRGNVVKLFRDEPGAAGMALDAGHSTLYVALQQGDAIAAIDTATLREKDRFSLGTEAGCPGYATFISG